MRRLVVVMLASLAAASSAAAGEVQTPTLESCLAKSVCRGLIVQAFTQTLGLFLKEVEGAPPNRFFDRTETFALRIIDKGGHFLRVLCVSGEGVKTECASQRDALEKRLLDAAVLQALPVAESKAELFGPWDWRTTSVGRRYLNKIRGHPSGIWKQLTDAAARDLSGLP